MEVIGPPREEVFSSQTTRSTWWNWYADATQRYLREADNTLGHPPREENKIGQGKSIFHEAMYTVHATT